MGTEDTLDDAAVKAKSAVADSMLHPGVWSAECGKFGSPSAAPQTQAAGLITVFGSTELETRIVQPSQKEKKINTQIRP